MLMRNNFLLSIPHFRCVWEILAPENHKITLNFTHFDLEGNAFYQPAACEYDAGMCVWMRKKFKAA